MRSSVLNSPKQESEVCSRTRERACRLSKQADHWESWGVLAFVVLAALAPIGFWLSWWDSNITRTLFVLAFLVLGGTDLKAESRRASSVVLAALAEFENLVERLLAGGTRI